MPIYEYKCGNCSMVFEQLMRSSTDRSAVCPKCGGKKLEKQLSPFSASISERPVLPCASGTCSTGSCSTGTCPFSNN